jgi:hypothetical protein
MLTLAWGYGSRLYFTGVVFIANIVCHFRVVNFRVVSGRLFEHTYRWKAFGTEDVELQDMVCTNAALIPDEVMYKWM